MSEMAFYDGFASAARGEVIIPAVLRKMADPGFLEGFERALPDLLKAFAEQDRVFMDTRRSDYWDGAYHHMSSLSKCLRAKFYRRAGAVPAPDSAVTALRTFQVFQHGGFSHLRWQALLAYCGFADVADREVGFTDGERMVEGKIDMIVDVGDGVRRIFDLKTINPNDFEKIRKSGKAKPAHVEQVNGYMSFSGLGIEFAHLVYEDKARHALVEIVVPHDPALAEASIARMREFDRYAESAELPPDEGRIPGSRAYGDCHFCPFVYVCIDPAQSNRVVAEHKHRLEEARHAGQKTAEAGRKTRTGAGPAGARGAGATAAAKRAGDGRGIRQNRRGVWRPVWRAAGTPDGLRLPPGEPG